MDALDELESDLKNHTVDVWVPMHLVHNASCAEHSLISIYPHQQDLMSNKW